MKAWLNKIKRAVKPAYTYIRCTIQKVKWYIQYLIVRYQGLYPRQLSILDIKQNKRIVILVPHADDEWIGPYSILKQRLPHLNCVYFNLFGNDYSEGNKIRRNSELKASSDFWGFNLINNYNYDVDALYEELLTSKYCFLPSPYDWHPEHRRVFQTFVTAYCKLTTEQKESLEVYYYSVSVPHSHKLHQHYIPLTKQEVDDKWRFFTKFYHSQAFMPSLRYKFQLRLVPNKIGYAAQMFVKANDDMLHEDLAKLDKQEMLTTLERLSGKINNIKEIRKAVMLFK